MKCPRCGKDLKIVVDEPMGEVDACVQCGTEVTVHYDRFPGSMDRVPKKASNDD
jgi:hypothetical protein